MTSRLLIASLALVTLATGCTTTTVLTEEAVLQPGEPAFATAEPAPVTEPEPTLTPSPTATPVPTATIAPTPAEPTLTPTTTPTAVPEPSPTATPTATTEPGSAPPPTPTATSNAPGPTPTADRLEAPAPGQVPATTFTHTLRATVTQPNMYTGPDGQTYLPSDGQGTPLLPINPTVRGNPLVFRVTAGQPGDTWAQVQVVGRPNGQTAWVETSEFTWGSSNRAIVIDVAARELTVWEGSNVVKTMPVAVGHSTTRTPRGVTYMTEVFAGPSAWYGPNVVPLALLSQDVNSFDGAPPIIAMMGTGVSNVSPGANATNGSIRLSDEDMTWLVGVMPVGSLVYVR